MKKIFVFLCFIFSSFFVNAQKWHIGLVNGVNFPNIYDPEGLGIELSADYKKRTFASGIGLLYTLNKNINFRNEIFYEERGWIEKGGFILDPTNGSVSMVDLNYFYPFITMPVLFEGNIDWKFNGKNISKLQFFANFGINTSLRIGGKTLPEDGSIPLVFVFPEDKKPTFDFAWIAGGGIRVPINESFLLQTEYRYYRSWTPIGVGFSVDSVFRHKGVLLNLSCYYSL